MSAESVTQADREAAANLAERFERQRGSTARRMREGRLDHFEEVQAFARHRLATQAPAPAFPREEVLEAIAQRAVKQIENGFSFETLTGPENLRARLSLCARQAAHDTAALLQGAGR